MQSFPQLRTAAAEHRPHHALLATSEGLWSLSGH
jgi:hypothetical protein